MTMTQMTQWSETTMKSKMLKSIGAMALLFSTSGVALASTVGFSPSPKLVDQGETFTVDIVGSGFTVEQPLSGGTFDIEFDSSLLEFVPSDPSNAASEPVVIDPYFDFLPEPGGPVSGNVWPGVGFDVFVNDAAVGDFIIATITLKALAAGTSELLILNSQFFSPTEQLFPDLPPGVVVVGPVVPVPAAVWLFGSGLLGLVGVARRKVS